MAKANVDHQVTDHMLMEQGNLVLDFDEGVWALTADNVQFIADGKLMFLFKNGTEIEWNK